MTVNDLLALLAATTAVRVFLPDLVAGMRRLLRAGARIGVAELLSAQPARAAGTEGRAAAPVRDEEA
ncbi:hypothetical protein [Streptomyces prasinopilosus]|uniref:Uncharacterized protein n=1 Tax=Streptomyces prasinopilosus TaxID=67344 RepID=A0A1G6PIU4_9ACTN|nr:hypothetical protein [Streptomyces prasinopilosus]SDC79504.1 hypothetical protein SAMN05216505_103598 [Streptomyces prasinopilosus]